MSRPFRIDPATLLAELRADLIKHGMLAFSPGETAKRLGMTPAAIQARLGKRDEVLVRVWLDARRTYVAAIVAAHDQDWPEIWDALGTALEEIEPDVVKLARLFDEAAIFGSELKGPLRAERRKLEADLRDALETWTKRQLKSLDARTVEKARIELREALALRD